MEPLLSIVLTGRNDAYGIKFSKRLSLSLNLLAHCLKELDSSNKIEVLLVDWNSDSPLAKELNLSSEAKEITKVINVLPKHAVELNFRSTPFHTTHSLNVGFKSASSKFLSMMPGDILWTTSSVNNLIAFLSGKYMSEETLEDSLMCVPRRFLPSDFDEFYDFSPLESIDDYLMKNGSLFNYDPTCPGINGGYGMFIFSKIIYEKVGGLKAELGGWGWSDIDLGFKVNQFGELIRTDGYGVICFDFKPTGGFKKTKAERLNEYRQVNLRDSENFSVLGKIDLTKKDVKSPYKAEPKKYKLSQLLRHLEKCEFKKISRYVYKNKCKLSHEEWLTFLITEFIKPQNYIQINDLNFKVNLIRYSNEITKVYLVPGFSLDYDIESLMKPYSLKYKNSVSFILGCKETVKNRVRFLHFSGSQNIVSINDEGVNIEDTKEWIRIFKGNSIMIIKTQNFSALKAAFEKNSIKHLYFPKIEIVLIVECLEIDTKLKVEYELKVKNISLSQILKNIFLDGVFFTKKASSRLYEKFN